MSDKFLAENPHLKDFVPYLQLLNSESDRGRVLISTGFLEEQLKEVLLAFMIEGSTVEDLIDGGNAPLGTFSSRIAACYGLGLISQDEYDDLTLIRKIRNDFAHDIRTNFSTPSVVSRCDALKGKAGDYTKPEGAVVTMLPSGQFQTAAVALIGRLINRAYYVKKQRRSFTAFPR